MKIKQSVLRRHCNPQGLYLFSIPPRRTSIKILNIFLTLAWYDHELAAYQKERQENELEKVFDERKQYLAEQSGTLKGVEHLKPKQIKTEAPEWQKTVLQKKNEEYYSKIQELEVEQLLKETNMRAESHQYAIPGEKIVSSSATKGMAKSYEENL